jgi:citrate lyase gamma subunit
MRILMMMILSVLTMSCATQKQAKPLTPSFIEIRFGNVGGFSGMTNEYLLKQDGKVYKNSNVELNFVNQIKQTEIENIEKQISELNLKNIELNEKGNLTYFIKVQTSTYDKKITWSDQTQNDSIKELYKSLVKTLNK